MGGHLLKHVLTALKFYYNQADQAEKIVWDAAIAAAVASTVGGLFPAIAIPAAIVECFGAVWIMYGALCKKLGINIKEKGLKILARAVLSNIAANLGGALAALLAVMLVPAASVLASAFVAFASVYLGGYVFLKLILNLTEKNGGPLTGDIAIDEVKEAIKDVELSKEHLDAVKEIFEANKDAIKKAKETNETKETKETNETN